MNTWRWIYVGCDCGDFHDVRDDSGRLLWSTNTRRGLVEQLIYDTTMTYKISATLNHCNKMPNNYIYVMEINCDK